ncbi:sulfotransferase family 2 domain-containing protein [Yoonia sediminilitoris]|uniref:LPS sulfotransferase NodH n=1 Tax=Yoonia sediminilitoris TaxID=1286148 RepID=A0A2T6KLP9_9RHOB|nr:sulfotransferase family 2 domain-containing protein [Yoonia sediminilitoris]PUB17114.1 hypothetical protein C8N45_102124 [Yoonia sediminilitoris]RCW97409.1 hypothetical protein DFP92_102124 [Yoonia sediminilitoris]
MKRFDYFVVFAEMRTGSNLLEANINRFADLSCHGEAFNPSFPGYPQFDDLLGIDLAAREADPAALIDRIKAQDGLAGFRFFNNHDARVLDICLPDPRCAKIILTRNPIDSFVSWKIAKATGQWKLTNATHAKVEKIKFDLLEFESFLGRIQTFQTLLLNRLQKSGQTAFYLAYEDLRDVDVMNGLAAFLGCDEQLSALDRKLKKQNPAPVIDKVTNPDEMREGLAVLDQFNLTRTPNFEPKRGPMVPAYVAAPDSGLLYLPLRGGLDGRMSDWMAAVDGKAPKHLRRGFSQKTLRAWKQNHQTHRSFAVLRHPVVRAHHAFCTHILFDGPRLFPKIRASLRKVHKLPIPAEPLSQHNLKGYDIVAHRTAFLAFVRFLQQNLSGQTAIRTDPAWASQLAVLQGMAHIGMPDHILREESLQSHLPFLCQQIGMDLVPPFADIDEVEMSLLLEIYDPEIEQAVRDAYARDYLAFGFENLR